MTCTIPVTASAANLMCEPTPTTTNCPCSLTEALHWVAVISEDAYRDVDLRRLLPAALAHFDLITERETIRTAIEALP